MKCSLPLGVSRPTWIVLELAGDYPISLSASPLPAVLRKTQTLTALLDQLDSLAEKDWLHGVLVKPTQLSTDLSTSRVIAEALSRLAKEKRVVAYVPQINMNTLLIASGCTQIVAPRSAEVTLSGLGIEPTFMGAFLKKHGIDFENLRIGEYKSMLTRFSQEAIDPANHEQLADYLHSAEEAWVEDIARGRKIDVSTVRNWLEMDYSSAQALQAAGVIDTLAYEDELMGPATQPIQAVLDLLKPTAMPSRDRIALITIEGLIVTGKSKSNPLPLPLIGGTQAGSETIIAALRRAGQDKATKAVVLYVNSGGGSALASDLIAREVAILDKPVVVVMGNTAASGGYYLSAPADRIIASPYTVTGSIGVVMGKPVLHRFNEEQGFKPEPIGRENALKYSLHHPFTPAQLNHLEQSISEVYDRFLECVAQGRNMTKERVHELGRGRIWSGRDALQHGLVDELGDLDTGIDRAIELAGVSYGTPIWHVTPKKQPFGQFFEQTAQSARLELWPFGQEKSLTWCDLTFTMN